VIVLTKAMPVILTTPEECDAWLAAPVGEALHLQRPLPDALLSIVARGGKQDGAPDSVGMPALLL
jgi:putative SOS response-associated peptidase YedK